MKILGRIIQGALILLTGLSVYSIGAVLVGLFAYSFDFSDAGLTRFLSSFSTFYGLYAANIALISVYYWIFQMSTSQKTLERIELDTADEKKRRALAASKVFYTEISPTMRGLTDRIKDASSDLLWAKWDLTLFTDESVNDQNDKWEVEYEKVKEQIEGEVTKFNFQLEALAAEVLHGNLDEELAYNLFGKPYCTVLSWAYPFIAGYRSMTRSQDYFNNIVELYFLWGSKVK